MLAPESSVAAIRWDTLLAWAALANRKTIVLRSYLLGFKQKLIEDPKYYDWNTCSTLWVAPIPCSCPNRRFPRACDQPPLNLPKQA